MIKQMPLTKIEYMMLEEIAKKHRSKPLITSVTGFDLNMQRSKDRHVDQIPPACQDRVP